MSERDPRIDPSFGDQVDRNGRVRRVEFVTLSGVVVYSTNQRTEHRCELTTWRRWARDAEVVQLGNPGQWPWDTVTVKLDYALGRELNAQRNRSNPHSFDQDVLGALIVVAFDVLERGMVSKQKLAEAIDRYRRLPARVEAGE